MSHRYFEGTKHAQLYAQARPGYCDQLFDAIFKSCQQGRNRFQLAVDVGCGTGHQSTLPLSSRFTRVIGTDISEAQLQQTPTSTPNIEFRHSPAEKLSFLEPETVDLVTTGTAIHWFDIPRFFQEVERILVPGGTMAVYGYDWPSLPEPEAQTILSQFIDTYLDPYETVRHMYKSARYSYIDFPFKEFSSRMIESFQTWTVDHLCEYLSTTSHWQRLLRDVPECGALESCRRRLSEFYSLRPGVSPTKITVSFIVVLMLGRKLHLEDQAGVLP